jgi:hypothetical protein
MGRKFFGTVVVTIAAIGMSAAPALAKHSGPTMAFSNGTGHMTMPAFHQDLRRMQANSTPRAAPQPGSLVERSGFLAECTVPQGGLNFVNFFTKDTTVWGGAGFFDVGQCTANLNNPQTKATASDHPGGMGLIPFSTSPEHSGTTLTGDYAELCSVTVGGSTEFGIAESLTYKDGEFSETCIAAPTL